MKSFIAQIPSVGSTRNYLMKQTGKISNLP